MKRLSTMPTVWLLCVSFAIPAGNASAQSTKDLVGAWMPASVQAYHDPAYNDPKGILIFDADGHFSLQLLRSDLPKLRTNKRDLASSQENKAIVHGSIAYYGTYTMNGTDLMLHIEGCSFPNWAGTDQKRTNVSIIGDKLTYTNPAPSIGTASVVLVWKRTK